VLGAAGIGALPDGAELRITAGPDRVTVETGAPAAGADQG
jgi:hypothetical protein